MSTKRYYTVKDASIILQKDEETIRRWCRNGKLHACIQSKKDGWLIHDDQIDGGTAPYRLTEEQRAAIQKMNRILNELQQHAQAIERLGEELLSL